MKFYRTSESVTEGHPDKVCDIIADAIVDAYLERDKNSLVSIKTLAAKNLVCLGGETAGYKCHDLDIESIVRESVKEIGYDDDDYGFDYKTLEIIDKIDKYRVDDSNKQVWNDKYLLASRDQNIVFGYACNETDQFLPLSFVLAHRLSLALTQLRKSKVLDYLKPDGKTMITVEYENGVPERVSTAIISIMHSSEISCDKIKNDLEKLVLNPILGKYNNETEILINQTGRFIVGGPAIDTGLTGRKIVVDAYGGHARHGGGALSGKDPSSTDRCGAYLARYIAKNIVASKLAEKCEIGFSYAIGSAEPLNMELQTFGTGKLSNKKIAELINKKFDLTISNTIKKLDLRRPIFTRTAKFGHFGDNSYGWEKIDYQKSDNLELEHV